MLVVIAAAARADAPIGFDHTLHERDVIVAGGDAIPCARCHELDRSGRLVGKPGHAACFGACHGEPPRAPARGKRFALDDDHAKLCASCHAPSALAAAFTGRMPVPYPPYTIERDFNLAFGHAQHAATTCTKCHDLARGAKPEPHARCAGCHGGTGATGAPPMAECTRCHPAAAGRPQPPELRPIQNSIAAIFSHEKHAARGADGRACTTCHAAIAQTNDSELPRPTAADCARCHDGTHAFATTEACTRCHTAPTGRFDVARPDARFRHDGPHEQIVGQEACTTCHALLANGAVVPAGHAACTGCHAADFGARNPVTCGACHIATEPWRRLRPDRPPPDATEFGATLDHAKHAGDCTTCHARRTAAGELEPPAGHTACTAAGCHAAAGGPAPLLTDCRGCHSLGRADQRLAARTADRWSVRATFSHGRHAAPGRTLPACTACHSDLAGADVVRLAVPAKAACASCHDGTIAFSLTGTSCKTCHRPPAAP